MTKESRTVLWHTNEAMPQRQTGSGRQLGLNLQQTHPDRQFGEARQNKQKEDYYGKVGR